jgi:hypothetical protein
MTPNFGQELSSALIQAPTVQPVMVVPVGGQPQQAAPKKQTTKKSSSTSTKTQTQQSAGGVFGVPLPNFGTRPTPTQYDLPQMPQQPPLNQNLSAYLGGQTVQQAIAPPQYQGFGLPVFQNSDLIGLTPEMYGNVLDTTKQNIGFNNEVAQSNYANRLKVIDTMRAIDEAEQRQYSEGIQNVGRIAQTNTAIKQGAYMQSPEEEATMRAKEQAYHSQLQYAVSARLAAIQHKYAMAREAASDARQQKTLDSAMKKEMLKEILSLGGDAIKEAWKTMSPEDAKRYVDAVSAGNPMEASDILAKISPRSRELTQSAETMDAMFTQMSGMPRGSLFKAASPAAEGRPQIGSLEDLQAHRKRILGVEVYE